MLNITITEQTPHNMLRAIRAACNELLGEQSISVGIDIAPGKDQTGIATMIRSAGGPVEGSQFYRVGEQPSEQTTAITIIEPVEDNRQDRVPAVHMDETAEELDSAGHAWSAELHASTKAKNQDGTWKKRRGAGKAEDAPEPPAPSPGLPPLPPAPPAAPLVTMNDIYALITNNKCVLNDVIAAAQAMGFADVGAFSRDATPEQRAQLLAQLTKEVA